LLKVLRCHVTTHVHADQALSTRSVVERMHNINKAVTH
jgi:hypothetical protein